ncbi:FecR domain-containing protein [Olivibacter sp. CPCC 100613]|uniref:FecR domain-containing protein n=1 Tax=Olivibacter sp. CPCC 100613 TaxID=3079931 RepID=UPI002FF5216F
MAEQEDIRKLLKRYLAGECTPEERTRVEQWYSELDIRMEKPAEEVVEADLAEIRNRLAPPPLRRTKLWYRYAAAVVAVFVIAIAAYKLNPTEGLKNREHAEIISNPQDIAPGGNRAVLKLADGSEITLNSSPNGEIAQEGAHAIYKNTDGELIYQLANTDRNSAEDPVFNTLQTPRGGQYHLVLPDSTKVWLNASSKLTYTLNSPTKERLVKLEGEAYFEVTKNPNRPFRVESKGQVVEVLGTAFNINSYSDESAVKTTLVDGAVRVAGTTKRESVVLQPGQQAVLDRHNRLSIKPTDLMAAIAWKHGKFSFKQADIGVVMRQLSRWYDVEVVFKGKKPNIMLSGEVYRNTHASKVLEILSFYNLTCRIETVNGVKQIIIQ